jgi:hypothetical protein
MAAIWLLLSWSRAGMSADALKRLRPSGEGNASYKLSTTRNINSDLNNDLYTFLDRRLARF